MEKYTNLEQVIQDSSLVLITENITTQRELYRTFSKYKSLPKRQKRLSNYYSNEFLGRNVSEMYSLMKDRLRGGSSTPFDWQPPNEKYAVSEPDLYYKEDSFNSGDTNICFILGHSGSGKSMMARTLEGDDIDHIELDDLLLTKDHFTMDELKDYSEMFYSFFSGEGAKYYIGARERDSIPKEEYEDKVFLDFVDFALEYAKQHSNKKFIIDGIWIYLYFDDPSKFEDYAVFIKGTSFLKSKIRVMKREMQRDKDEVQDRKKMFGRETRNYLLDEDKIDKYREYFGDKPDTVFREEQDESAIKKTLSSIDRCFVDEDANGLLEILKNAKASNELSGWEKQMVSLECKSAALDLFV